MAVIWRNFGVSKHRDLPVTCKVDAGSLAGVGRWRAGEVVKRDFFLTSCADRRDSCFLFVGVNVKDQVDRPRSGGAQRSANFHRARQAMRGTVSQILSWFGVFETKVRPVGPGGGNLVVGSRRWRSSVSWSRQASVCLSLILIVLYESEVIILLVNRLGRIDHFYESGG